MDERDPPPFGYTFTADFLEGSPTFANGGPGLLSENENQHLIDFFSNTDPFLSGPSSFPPAPETKESLEGLNWDYVPPATIHSVSTTIPDQSQLQHGFHTEQNFLADPLSGHLGNTHDDLQAASTLSSTLFSNAPPPHVGGRSYSFHGLPSSGAAPSSVSSGGLHNMPMVQTQHGLINEQLAALLPNHTEDGSIDAQLAAQFATSNAQRKHEEDLVHLEKQRPQLKRSYTYGTDSAFNDSGFVVSSPQQTEEHVTRRLLHDMMVAQHLMRPSTANGDDVKPPSPSGHITFSGRLPLALEPITSDNDGQSQEGTSDDDDDDGDRPAKKRRKGKGSISAKIEKNGSARKSISAGRPGKNRKASMDDQAGKKKRLSSAGQKHHRENLTEEQKRNNHILSEQKRRNLIKRGFDDLHDLVPEIRNGGLSKSSVLMEAANFLDKLIADNKQFLALAGTADG